MRWLTSDDESGPLILVASAGGHLTQLHWLRRRLRPGGDRPAVWVTSAGPQVEHLDPSDDVILARHIPPRDLVGVLRSLPLAVRTCWRLRPTAVVSTGSALALAYLPVAALLRRRAIYIESATRDTGPSLTGRLLQRVPGIRLCTQSPSWANPRWHYVGSVLDSFESTTDAAALEVGHQPIRRVVVTLGTMSNFPFRRLVERMLDILPDDVEVVWQTGCTEIQDLPIVGHVSIPAPELRRAISEADVVVAHAGTGTALTCLELGRCPVLVPREHAHGEHVDDHQSQTAARLARQNLAVVRTVDALALSDLEDAARRSIATRPDASQIMLP